MCRKSEHFIRKKKKKEKKRKEGEEVMVLKWPEEDISFLCYWTAIQRIKKLNLDWQFGMDFSAALSTFVYQDLFWNSYSWWSTPW